MRRLGYWAFVACFVFSSEETSAYSLSSEPLCISVVKADAIVVAVATELPSNAGLLGGSGGFTIEESIKGPLETGLRVLKIHQDQTLANGTIEEGKKYILFLRKNAEGESPDFETKLHGTGLLSEERKAEVEEAVAAMPRWSSEESGVASILTTNKRTIDRDEDLVLYLGYRNDSDAALTLTYRDWPPEKHTHWTLDISKDSGERVLAEEHPHLDSQKIESYFSQHGRTFEIVLQPGESYFYGIDRVNSAQSGMGFKEKLKFQYYPIRKPGIYFINAMVHNLFEVPPPSPAPLTITFQ